MSISSSIMHPGSSTIAKQAFRDAFPKGHELIETSSSQLECGLHAIILSVRHQTKCGFPVPTLTELRAVQRTESVALAFAAVDMLNRDNFTVDQLAAILYQWGCEKKLNMQLGCITEHRQPELYSTETSYRDDTTTVWVHNTSAKTSLKDDVGLEHYSGIRRRRSCMRRRLVDGLHFDQVPAVEPEFPGNHRVSRAADSLKVPEEVGSEVASSNTGSS